MILCPFLCPHSREYWQDREPSPVLSGQLSGCFHDPLFCQRIWEMLHVFVCDHKIRHLLQVFQSDLDLFKTDRKADLFIKGTEFFKFLIVLVYQ